MMKNIEPFSMIAGCQRLLKNSVSAIYFSGGPSSQGECSALSVSAENLVLLDIY